MPTVISSRPILRTATGEAQPATLTPADAAALLGVSRSTGYDLVRAGTWPTPTTPPGSGPPRVLTVPLLDYLHIPYKFIRDADANPAS